MNYRHIYHAGNFADVFKHAVLVRIIEYLKRKDAAFRVIDTHAGAGLYELSSDAATKTGEWRLGAGRLINNAMPQQAAHLLEPYISIVKTWIENGRLTAYPGSPMLARHLLRHQDRISMCELHEGDQQTLAGHFAGDWQARVMQLDGWLVAGAHLPPKEKRGLVLIDPPFEAEGEFERLVEALQKGVHRWPGGIFMLWYPLKNNEAVAAFIEALRQSGINKLLRVELCVRGAHENPVLRGSGLIIRNPPYVLVEELETILPELSKLLAHDDGASWLIQPLDRK